MITNFDNEMIEFLTTQFAKIEQNFQLIHERLKLMDQKFTEIDQRFEQIDQRFAQIDLRFYELEFKLDSLGKRHEHVEVRVASLEVGQDKMLKELVTIREELAVSPHRIVNIEQWVKKAALKLDLPYRA